MDTDPLDGVGIENPETTIYYRLQEVIFAEPLADSSIRTDSDRTDDNVSNIKRDVQNFSTDDSAKVVCPQVNCGRHFKTVGSLKSHTRRVHNMARYSCDVCNETYRERYMLRRHMGVHENVKKECPVCTKKLSIRTNMALHLRSHDQRRPFVCTQCDKSFLRRVTMEVHVKYLHRSVPLSCIGCGIVFKRRVDYQRHLETHVKRREVECEFCGKLFCTLAALGAHRAKKHEISP